MSGCFKRMAWRLVDILSKLELPPEKGCVWGLNTNLPTESTQLKTAIRLIIQSAKCCRESFVFLRAGVCSAGYCLQNLANSFRNRLRLQACIFASRQPQMQTSHPSQDSCSHSCPPENTRNEVLSNAKKVDAPGVSAEPLKSCLHTSEKTQTLSFSQCSGIGTGGHAQQSVPVSQHSTKGEAV